MTDRHRILTWIPTGKHRVLISHEKDIDETTNELTRVVVSLLNVNKLIAFTYKIKSQYDCFASKKNLCKENSKSV